MRKLIGSFHSAETGIYSLKCFKSLKDIKLALKLDHTMQKSMDETLYPTKPTIHFR